VRILYLCHRIPYPPDKGDKIRAYHQLKVMASCHEVDLFTLADDPADLAHRNALAAHCRRLHVARVHPTLARVRSLPYFLSNRPLTLPYFRSRELAAQVERAMAERSYDRIFVYCSAMAQYLSGAGVPTLIDLVDVDSDKWGQYADHARFPSSAVYRREQRTLRSYERVVCESVAGVLVSTEREARLARTIAPAASVHVLSNGVDTEYFQPAERRAPDPVIIFTGDMKYLPNEEAVIFFAQHVLPLIRRQVVGAKLLVVGRNPSRRVLALRQVGSVEVTGFVPDIRVWLAKARIATAPFTIAAGIQNKVLEAMASGLPVVATPRTVQGLAPEVAAIVRVGNSAEELASESVRLLLDAALSKEVGEEGRRIVADHYCWRTVAARLLDLLENASSRARPANPHSSPKV
jgi:sugar transferase (PEP-CTERM/EpsH1 system associated)